MRFTLISALLLSLSTLAACNTESNSEQNAIKDSVYRNQFGVLEKANNVEDIVLDAAQSKKRLIEEQTNQ